MRAIREHVAALNALVPRTLNWFVCTDCSKLLLGCGRDMPTTKWGETSVFCPACIRTCTGCEEQYVESLAYQHEDCERASSSNDDDESSSKES